MQQYQKAQPSSVGLFVLQQPFCAGVICRQGRRQFHGVISMRYIDRVFLSGVLLDAVCSVDAQPLRILTTEVPPMAFVKDDKLQGFCVDVVQNIQRRLGESITITVLPWARAYHKAQTEPGIMLVCPKRTAEREHKFRWVGPLPSLKTVIYVRAGTHAKLASLDEAKELSNILVVRASYSYQDLTGSGFHNLYEVNDGAGMVRMLMANRAPAMILERQQLEAVLREVGVERQALTAIFEMQSPTSNLAFSRDVPAQTVSQWQMAFDAMRRDGSYGKLYDKWFPAIGGGRRR
jgi:polar amino acid transport system substrate-binding protein